MTWCSRCARDDSMCDRCDCGLSGDGLRVKQVTGSVTGDSPLINEQMIDNRASMHVPDPEGIRRKGMTMAEMQEEFQRLGPNGELPNCDVVMKRELFERVKAALDLYSHRLHPFRQNHDGFWATCKACGVEKYAEDCHSQHDSLTQLLKDLGVE